MNGNAKIALGLLALAGAGAAAWYYFRADSAGADGDDDGSAASGDTSLGGSSGAAASTYDAVAEGLTNAAASVGYTLGVYSPKGLRNHNPGNLRYVASIPWNGQIGDDGTGYAVFDSDEHGVRALGHQLGTYANRGLTSVRQI